MINASQLISESESESEIELMPPIEASTADEAANTPSDQSQTEGSADQTQGPSQESGFTQFHLAQPLLRALGQLKFKTPTPVQLETIPVAMNKRDLLSTAQTGTGKTAAFVLPVMNRKLKGEKTQTLILAPTRELALQIQKMVLELNQFARQIKSGVVIGGTGYAQQTRLLHSKPTFVIGTPGRLIDQIKLGNLKLENFGTLVLDEADRLLDMGFEPQIEEILAYFPAERHTMLFSATLPPEIERLARRYMKDPVRISIGAVAKPVEKIEQELVYVREAEKPEALLREIDKVSGSIIVFTKTKYRTEQVAKFLAKSGCTVARIHGGRSQSQRNEAIRGFRDGEYRVLVATDIAARGIDIPQIRCVVNYDLPLAAEDYVHRIGRTARAGASGTAVAFITQDERLLWAKIHRLMYGKWPEDSLKLVQERNRARSEAQAKKAEGKLRAGTSKPTAFSRDQAAKATPNRAARRKMKFGAKKSWDQNEAFAPHKAQSPRDGRPARRDDKKRSPQK